MKRCIAVLGLAFLAFPGAALAVPAQDDLRRSDPSIQSGSLGVPPHVADRQIPSHLPATGTDVAAPDQQASAGAGTPVHLPAIGTDVAALDQQASTRAGTPASASASDTGGFDWADAGIGAAGMASLLAISLAGAVTLRRRQTRRPSALAG